MSTIILYVNFKLGFHEVVLICELRALPLAYLHRLTSNVLLAKPNSVIVLIVLSLSQVLQALCDAPATFRLNKLGPLLCVRVVGPG